MIDFQGVSKSYSGEYILKDVSFRINDGERVGIVGPNGAGKSTLFNLISGVIAPDCGNIAIPRDHRLGIMRQTSFSCEGCPNAATCHIETCSKKGAEN